MCSYMKNMSSENEIAYCDSLYYLLTAGNIAGRNAHQPSTLLSPCTHKTVIIYYKIINLFSSMLSYILQFISKSYKQRI